MEPRFEPNARAEAYRAFWEAWERLFGPPALKLNWRSETALNPNCRGMPDRPWKAVERRIARKLGGRRVPVPGRAGAPDVRHEWLAIEVKSRQRLPKWLKQALKQAEAAARPGQLPVVVLHEKGSRKDLVLLGLDSFVEWFDPAGEGTLENPGAAPADRRGGRMHANAESA